MKKKFIAYAVYESKDIFIGGKKGNRAYARILRTKKLARNYYPEHIIRRCLVQILVDIPPGHVKP